MKKSFRLIETILWDKKIKDDKLSKNGFFLLKYHIDRLNKSANYFNFNFDKNCLINKINSIVKKFVPTKKYKVRILLNKNGKIKIQYFTLKEKNPKSKRIFLSKQKIDKKNIFIYHKTTNRKIYDKEYKKHQKYNYYDVLFKNDIGQITEFSRGNIFLKMGNKLITPPVSCGLLDGVFRKYLLNTQKNILVRPIYEEDLLKADKIFYTNSVQKIVEVEIPKKFLTNST